jgi:hypothetical protein
MAVYGPSAPSMFPDTVLAGAIRMPKWAETGLNEHAKSFWVGI